jgi:hypothetical protein
MDFVIFGEDREIPVIVASGREEDKDVQVLSDTQVCLFHHKFGNSCEQQHTERSAVLVEREWESRFFPLLIAPVNLFVEDLSSIYDQNWFQVTTFIIFLIFLLLHVTQLAAVKSDLLCSHHPFSFMTAELFLGSHDTHTHTCHICMHQMRIKMVTRKTLSMRY